MWTMLVRSRLPVDFNTAPSTQLSSLSCSCSASGTRSSTKAMVFVHNFNIPYAHSWFQRSGIFAYGESVESCTVNWSLLISSRVLWLCSLPASAVTCKLSTAIILWTWHETKVELKHVSRFCDMALSGNSLLLLVYSIHFCRLRYRCGEIFEAHLRPFEPIKNDLVTVNSIRSRRTTEVIEENNDYDFMVDEDDGIEIDYE